MSVRHASDLTVVELKEKLKELGFSCYGNKNELVLRLNESVPSGVWMENQAEAQASGDRDEAAGGADKESIYVTETQSEHRPRDARMLEMELEILRREVELLKTRSQTTARVSDARVDSETRAMQPKINMNAIAELLATFDGTAENFEVWDRQLRLLKRTYRLNDEHTRILIGMRLKGKALEWLHSRAELVESLKDR